MLCVNVLYRLNVVAYRSKKYFSGKMHFGERASEHCFQSIYIWKKLGHFSCMITDTFEKTLHAQKSICEENALDSHPEKWKEGLFEEAYFLSHPSGCRWTG